MRIPVTDRNEDGSATVCSQCERPDECGLAEVAHASGPLHLCGVCFDELPACENCGERGGSPREWNARDLDTGQEWRQKGCSRCWQATVVMTSQDGIEWQEDTGSITSERCPF